MVFLRHRCQGQKCVKLTRYANWQSLEIKCVIYIRVKVQAKEIRYVCRNDTF